MAEFRQGRGSLLRYLVLATEAAVWLAVARVALRTLSFAQLTRFATAPLRPLRDGASGRSVAEGIGRAVEAAARRAPWPTLCFEKGLAAHAMLRLRGRPSILYYGGRNDPLRGLTAHVWVRLGGSSVVGGDAAADFVVLAAFPSMTPAERVAG